MKCSICGEKLVPRGFIIATRMGCVSCETKAMREELNRIYNSIWKYTTLRANLKEKVK